MKGTALVLNAALAGAIAIGATGIQGLHAAEEQEEYKPKVEVTTLLQAPLEETEGKEVITLLNETLSDGPKEVQWDGTSAGGSPVSSGVYFYRLKAGKNIRMKKMVLLK